MKTTCQEGARGVAAREEVVAAAGPVGRGRGGYVVDCAVKGEIDWFGGVGAVEEGEFGVGEGDVAVLDNHRQCGLWDTGRDWGRTSRLFHSPARVHHTLYPHVIDSPLVAK